MKLTEERAPFEILNQRLPKDLISDTVAIYREADRRDELEDEHHAEEHLPRIEGDELVLILKPADEEIKDQCDGPGHGNRVVREDVGEDGELRRHFHVACDYLPDHGRYWAFPEPVVDWVEQLRIVMLVPACHVRRREDVQARSIHRNTSPIVAAHRRLSGTRPP
jgi:hypothetical protein